MSDPDYIVAENWRDRIIELERERINRLLVEIRYHWIEANGKDSISVLALDKIAEVITDGSYVKERL